MSWSSRKWAFSWSQHIRISWTCTTKMKDEKKIHRCWGSPLHNNAPCCAPFSISNIVYTVPVVRCLWHDEVRVQCLHKTNANSWPTDETRKTNGFFFSLRFIFRTKVSFSTVTDLVVNLLFLFTHSFFRSIFPRILYHRPPLHTPIHHFHCAWASTIVNGLEIDITSPSML